ncbi:MAG: phenylalanine ammonia-lyase [Dethiosulfovibrio peptidovorans]|nr:MAG: phenylalanine ammonia-lyase [Dethiosulfovibrio peptidovorans]
MIKVVLDGTNLTLDLLRKIACEEVEVEIAPDGLERLNASRQLVNDLVESDVPVYGFNTGVGWNKDRHIASDYFKAYNENLVHSHTLGMDPEASEAEVRAAMTIRLNCLLSGNTGVQAAIAHRYVDFLNHRIHPVVPERGSIGEADITELSHIGLAMIGEGEVIYRGERISSKEAHQKAGLDTVILGPKDGLAIVSSNAFGAAQGALVLADLLDLVDQADLIYAVSLEGLNGNVSPLNEKTNALRRMPGQIVSTGNVRRFLSGSYIETPDPQRPVQDPLSFRGGAYIHGSLRDAMEYVLRYLLVQMNTSDDNPCILLDERRIISCSNFEVTTLAVGFEMLAIMLSHVSKASCYRSIRLSNPVLTKLPRFLTPEETHVHAFGALQKSFTLLDTEIRHLSNPSTADFFSLAGGMEDHASNLPHVAQRLRRIIDNLKYILGMEMIHGAQAITLRRQKNPDLPLGCGTEAAFDEFRKKVSWYDRDRNLSTDIQMAYEVVRSGQMLKAARQTRQQVSEKAGASQ